MNPTNPAKALAIYIAETDQFHGKPLYIALVEKAKEAGMAGATVTRAIMGYGAHNKIHSTNILLLSENLPVMVTIIDSSEKITTFLQSVDQMVSEGTVVSWDVNVEVHRPGAP